MRFAIQSSNPVPTSMVSADDTTLGEAIESIFPLHTEFAFVIWNDIYVPLTYKYDISIIIEDVLDLMTTITGMQMGSMTVEWPSNTFRAIWSIDWNENSLVIDSHWISVIGGTENLLNRASRLETDTRLFLAEWRSIIALLNDLLPNFSSSERCDYWISALRTVLQKIPHTGSLYCH